MAAKPCSIPSEEDEGAGGAEAEDTAAVEAAAATSSSLSSTSWATIDSIRLLRISGETAAANTAIVWENKNPSNSD